LPSRSRTPAVESDIEAVTAAAVLEPAPPSKVSGLSKAAGILRSTSSKVVSSIAARAKEKYRVAPAAPEVDPFLEDIDHECDIAVIGGGATFVEAVRSAAEGGKHRVAACVGNPFMEWQMASPLFISDPRKHKEWLCGVPLTTGVTYIADCVTRVDHDDKIIHFGSRRSTLSYKALILCTGRRLPLLAPTPGDTLLERMSEVREAGKLIMRAKCVLLCGAGLIGAEVAATMRKQNPRIERIILLSRTGLVLSDTHSKVGAAATAPPQSLRHITPPPVP
jgi:hypothetical protein